MPYICKPLLWTWTMNISNLLFCWHNLFILIVCWCWWAFFVCFECGRWDRVVFPFHLKNLYFYLSFVGSIFPSLLVFLLLTCCIFNFHQFVFKLQTNNIIRHASTCYRLVFHWHSVQCSQKPIAFTAYLREVVAAFARIKCFKIDN